MAPEYRPETEQDRDLRMLWSAWKNTCPPAKEAFLRGIGISGQPQGFSLDRTE
jgi:hypothetical protein